MIEIALKIIVCLALAAFIGFLIGFLLGRVTRQEDYATITNPKIKKQANIYNKPLIFSSPRPGGKDNLREIEGITPDIENDLHLLGIFHFDQISKWNPKNCEWIEEYLEISNQIKEEKWVEQAKALSSFAPKE